MPVSLTDYARISHSRPGRRILAVELPELVVDCGIKALHCARNLKKRFAHHREKLGWTLRGVRIDRQILVGVDAATEIGITRAERVRPALAAHVPMQRRIAVGVAVEHVELMREFVYHDVDAVA